MLDLWRAVGIDLDKAGMDDAVRAAGDSLAPLWRPGA